MVAEIRQRAIDVLVRSRAWSRAESVLDTLDRAGLVLVDAAALRELLGRCELRSSGLASCCVCDGRRVGEPSASVPHVEECPVRALRASLPREEG